VPTSDTGTASSGMSVAAPALQKQEHDDDDEHQRF
jgi:hypothetical protein